SFNGVFSVDRVIDSTTFTVRQAGADAASGGGRAAVGDYGSVVLGGTIYDATQFPAEYRGDLFFGDYGSGELVPVETGGNGVSRVEHFGSGFGVYIDAAVGPDGALYLVRFGGEVTRLTYDRQDLGI